MGDHKFFEYERALERYSMSLNFWSKVVVSRLWKSFYWLVWKLRVGSLRRWMLLKAIVQALSWYFFSTSIIFTLASRSSYSSSLQMRVSSLFFFFSLRNSGFEERTTVAARGRSISFCLAFCSSSSCAFNTAYFVSSYLNCSLFFSDSCSNLLTLSLSS